MLQTIIFKIKILGGLVSGLLAGLFFYTNASPNIISSMSTSTLPIAVVSNESSRPVVFKKDLSIGERGEPESIIQSSPEIDGESIINTTLDNDSGIPNEIKNTAVSSSPSVASVTPLPTSLVVQLSGDSYASNSAIYAPTDAAPVDPIGNLSAEWLKTAWKNLPNKIPENKPPEVLAMEMLSSVTTSTADMTTSTLDQLPNAEVTTSTATSTIVASAIATDFHIVIFQITIGSASSNFDEFVELYNPTTSTISLSGWKLRRATASGKTVNYLLNPFPSTAFLSSMNFALIASSKGFSSTTPDEPVPDAWYSGSSTLAPSNTVSLINQAGDAVDLVGFGEAGIFEGAPAAELKNDGEALMRNFGAMMLDTDNNAFDFHLEPAAPHKK